MTTIIASVLLAVSLQGGDSAAVVKTVESFHAALANGDSAAALALLSEDAVVVESGEVETYAQYRSHHLPADIEFAKAVPSVRKLQSVRIAGDVAWIVATSSTEGTFRDRAINSVGAELVVLRRTKAGWKVTAIHWSSHARRR